MIGLLIQDNAYEQDIRELLMSFYPGETWDARTYIRVSVLLCS